MKKKEKEHLKADPFVHFVERVLAFFKANRRPLLMGAGIAAAAAVVLIALFLFRNISAAGENRLYAEAFRVVRDDKSSSDQKIAALQGMEFRRGISAAGWVFLASQLYEKGDLARAESVLKDMPRSRVALVNDQKDLLHSRVLAAGGKSAEAEAVLEGMLASRATVQPRETILLQLAKLQLQAKRSDKAAATLKRILSEHPNTPASMEAQELLSGLEDSPAAAD